MGPRTKRHRDTAANKTSLPHTKTNQNTQKSSSRNNKDHKTKPSESKCDETPTYQTSQQRPLSSQISREIKTQSCALKSNRRSTDKGKPQDLVEFENTNGRIQGSLSSQEIRSVSQLNNALLRNPDKIFGELIEKTYHRARIYCTLMELLDSKQRTAKFYRRFAEEYGLHRKTVTDWANGVKKPRLVRDLENRGLTASEPEEIVSEQSTMFRNLQKTVLEIDSKSVYEWTSNPENKLSIEKVMNGLKAILKVHGSQGIRFWYVDFSKLETTHSLDCLLQENQGNIIDSLNDWVQRAGLDYEYRIGLVRDRMYIWKYNPSYSSLLTAWQNEYFYFDNLNLPVRILRLVANCLGYGDRLGEMYSHFTALTDQLVAKKAAEPMKNSRFRIIGGAMHLICDILGLSIKEFEGTIERVTGANGQGGVLNPIILEGDDFLTAVAGVIGAVVSDSHVRKQGSIAYYESNRERVILFQQLLGRFGVIQWDSIPELFNGTRELWIPAAISNIIRFIGIPSGDRTILNYGLPSDVHSWPDSAKCEYMKQMLAQESWVGGEGRIMWSRSCALHAGDKSEVYNFVSLVTPSAVTFLRESNEMKQLKKQPGFEKIRERYITYGKLRDLAESLDENIALVAHELLKVSKEYRNRLIDDEVKMARSLGARVSLRPQRISYHENTGRITVSWGANISSQKSLEIVAKRFLPDHPEKARRLLKQT